MAIVTCDLFDAHPKAQSCDLQFRSLGQRKSFAGRIRTIRCHEDNQLVKETLAKPSDGEVLVVDGGGSVHTALMGDMIAKSGMNNGWAGVIINGAVRDSETLDGLDFAAKALGSNPRKSAKDGTGERDVAVTFGGVTFVPGHYLYSDADGILVSEHPLEA